MPGTTDLEYLVKDSPTGQRFLFMEKTQGLPPDLPLTVWLGKLPTLFEHLLPLQHFVTHVYLGWKTHITSSEVSQAPELGTWWTWAVPMVNGEN